MRSHEPKPHSSRCGLGGALLVLMISGLPGVARSAGPEADFAIRCTGTREISDSAINGGKVDRSSTEYRFIVSPAQGKVRLVLSASSSFDPCTSFEECTVRINDTEIWVDGTHEIKESKYVGSSRWHLQVERLTGSGSFSMSSLLLKDPTGETISRNDDADLSCVRLSVQEAGTNRL